ncbi:ParA family protein [Paenibacillus sp. P96]|uniref:ParA family protein n=1 Tax=Paenibacillus zeirhizosphaerae TaxID=2987519 RepID=A0ABT9FWG4_9BACL|nr:ParA family protein [Paenibacillus sp. P96]MDP4098876.1 ParA family protein [Paenibacillus sp. P96]
MKALRVVLAVQSREYIEPLLDYLHGSEYAKRIRVTAFSQPDAFYQYMREPIDGKMPDAVVGEAVFFEGWRQREESRVSCFLLSEEGRSEPGVVPLRKYQPVSHLLETIWDECRRRLDGDIRMSSREETMVVGFVSASGGAGKTTAALNAAKQLGGAGYSVFYLNMETADSSSLFTPTVEGMTGLSRLLYDMKTQGTYDLGSAAAYSIRQHDFKADIFQPLANRKEIAEMSYTESCELIHVLARTGQYDVIIVDTDAELNARTEAVLKTGSRLIWLLSDDLISMHKCRLRLNQLQISNKDGYDMLLDKTLFVLNRCAGEQVNDLPYEGMTLHGILPYIPSWKQMDREELMLNSPIYQREIRKLCRMLLNEDAVALEEPVRA